MQAEKLTVVYDNRSLDEKCAADWGFGCVIQTKEHCLLFDVGAKREVLGSNMELLWVPDCSHIFLSHNHWDHTDGIEAALRPGLVCYIVPSAMETLGKRVLQLGGIPIATETGQEILPGIWTTGEIDADPPEQGLVFKASFGLVLITGCAHPGIVTMVKRVGEIFGEAPTLVIGGFHWYENSPKGVERDIQTMKELGVEQIGPCHCTGDKQIEIIKRKWGDGFHKVGAGWSLELKDFAYK